ncbi:glycoside hydrolase family 88 protein [Mycobacterium sp. 21AC1]|uniref:glycoside hydrolase family 88 protein n=1 Tax=[Mycobacterium] appelbergii TaxID=2939269 RepID=UPI002938F072|nr:glycoside hydrolase family 88 protein [Mycobacterium sp. 21AC1]MDV3127233.1 glycoside hydrolase family 88 protein [Mycobacterium sp. 21AC1]
MTSTDASVLPTESDFLTTAHARVLDAVSHAPVRSGHYVENGRWKQVSVAEGSFWTDDSYDHGNWTSGFWVGCLLHLHQLGAPAEAELAAALAGATAVRALDETTHDVGFMFWPSAVLLSEEREAHGDTASAKRWGQVALTAAETLAKRFRPAGGYLQAFGALNDVRGQATSTIDTMMNLPLLWWCARRFDRDDLQHIAHQHALTTSRDLIRDDGASFHLVHHNLDGSLRSRGTFQGAGDQSCWTRGQAWAIHGFIDAYLATGEIQFVDVAARCLQFWADHAPFGELPPYDLLATTGLFDASASAILASGLADAAADPVLAEQLDARERLDQVLTTLARDALFSSPAGIIGRSTYSAPHGWGVDGALPYGDYFYLRALTKNASLSRQPR